MKKPMKFTSMLLALALTVAVLPTAAFATEIDVKTEAANVQYGEAWVSELELTPEMQEFYNRLEKMSVEELSELLNDLTTGNESVMLSTTEEPPNVVSAAWFTLGELLKKAGYPCTGTLMQYSANGQDYHEVNGIFAAPIRATTQYKQWVRNRTKNYHFVFEDADGKDLKLSLHECTLTNYVLGSTGGRCYIYDLYDFAWSNEISVVAGANNLAYLSQYVSALKKINVNIDFDM